MGDAEFSGDAIGIAVIVADQMEAERQKRMTNDNNPPRQTWDKIDMVVQKWIERIKERFKQQSK